ncbi:MAG: prepilin-type N-terminal cleavage/methylation domain-containing protein [Patescibacteria group bacterium]
MNIKLKKNGLLSKNLTPSKGFTLIELLVTLSLFVVLTTIVIFSQSKFNGSILLTNLAYDVALTVRQAQSYGVNVREVASDTSTGFKHAYGVHFDIANDKEFILFSDSVGGDGNYKEGDDSLINKYKIKRGSYISNLCVNSSCDNVSKLDITFLRPNPDAIIKGDSATDETEAKITISSSDGATRTVIIYSTGQISIGR